MKEIEDKDSFIYAKIKDKSYFSDGFNWYCDMFLYPLRERTFFLITAIIVSISLLITYINYKSVPQSKTKLPFIVYADNTRLYFSNIKHLIKNNETPHEAVIKYLLSDYIKSREEYSFEQHYGENLAYLIKKIKVSSVKKISDEFSRYISPKYEYSPINRYERNFSRRIKIKKIDFLTDDLIKGKAIVTFTAKEINHNFQSLDSDNKKDSAIKNSQWEATVYYVLPDIRATAMTESKLGFLITYYSAKLIK